MSLLKPLDERFPIERQLGVEAEPMVLVTVAFRAAFTHPEFIAKLSTYPLSAVAAQHLFQKVAVAGICTA